MSVERQFNALGQERFDVPHLRSIESSICNDFDVLAGNIISGTQALVVNGFTISTAGAIGSQPNTLTMITAGSTLMNVDASESGTIFSVPDDRAPEVLNTTNPRVFGTFTNSRACYIGIDLLRSADNSTSDLAEFISADTLLESGQIVPLGRTLDYRIIISTSDFSSQPNVCPIAIVTTNSSGAVTNIQDARQLASRLGSGGTLPNSQYSYPWPGGRSENLSGNVFSGGDKGIASIWESTQAVMTRLWEIGGGQYWYSSARTVDVRLVRLLSERFSNGDNFEISSGNVLWQGLRMVFANALGIAGDSYQGLPVYYNDIKDQTTPVPGQTDLVDGQVLYVDLDQTTVHDSMLSSPNGPLIMQKGIMASMGTPTIPGSRFIIAWATESGVWTRDSTYQIGAVYAPASTTANGIVTLNQTAFNSAQPVVTVANASGAAIASGLSRGNGSAPDFGAGTLAIGQGSSDTTIAIGTTTVTGQIALLGMGPAGGTNVTRLDGNSIFIGGQSTTPLITIGSTVGGDVTAVVSTTVNLTSGDNNTANVNVFSGVNTAYLTGNLNIFSNSTRSVTGPGNSGNIEIGNNNVKPWIGYTLFGDAVAASYSPLAKSVNIVGLTNGLALINTPFLQNGGSSFQIESVTTVAIDGSSVALTTGGGTINIANESTTDTVNIGYQGTGSGIININPGTGGEVNIATTMTSGGVVVIGNTTTQDSMAIRSMNMIIQSSQTDYGSEGGIQITQNTAGGNLVHIQADVEVDPGHGIPTVSASDNTSPFTGGGAPTLALYTNAVSSNHGRLAITLNGATISTAGATQSQMAGGWTIATVTFGRVNVNRDQGHNLVGDLGAGPFVVLGNPCGVIGVSLVITGTGLGSYSVDVPYALSTVPIYTSGQLSGFKININFAWSLFVTGATFSNFTITGGILSDVYWSVV